MRKPIHPAKKHQSFGVSFPPALRNAARKRAYNVEMNLSRYLQHLVEADLGTSPLPESFERVRTESEKSNRNATHRQEQQIESEASDHITFPATRRGSSKQNEHTS